MTAGSSSVFFSSRRRHTIFDCDWSSDVCSSDLVLTGPQHIIFINRGRADGVSPGDVFEAFKPASGLPGTSSEQVQVVVEIVHTRDHSSSGLILNIEHPNLVPGMPVRLIRKMPS